MVFFNIQAHKVLPRQRVKVEQLLSESISPCRSRLGYGMSICSTEIEGSEQVGLNSLHHFLAFPTGACASMFIACQPTKWFVDCSEEKSP